MGLVLTTTVPPIMAMDGYGYGYPGGYYYGHYGPYWRHGYYYGHRYYGGRSYGHWHH